MIQMIFEKQKILKAVKRFGGDENRINVRLYKSVLLCENGEMLLQENGDKILLEIKYYG